MNVGTRLRGAFAIYIALLAAVVVYHVRTIQRTVASGHALAEISSRQRVAATDQVARIAQMNSDAEKYYVTRDIGYLNRVLESSTTYGRELARLETMPLAPQERSAFDVVSGDWKQISTRVPRLAAISSADGADAADARAVITAFQRDLDRLRTETEQLGAASQNAMSAELSTSETAAASAERLSWIAALGALVLSVVLSALLLRSIVGPLGRLAQGTKAVSAGRYDYRLDTAGDDEFSQVAHDFNSMTERLGELDRMKRDFVAKVSHDLKTPLSSMQETISVLLDGVAGDVSPKQRQLLELNLESGKRLSAMLNKLLDLSRIEAGLAPDLELLDVGVLVRRSIERIGATGSDRHVRIAFDDLPQRVIVRGDATGLAQVVDNLLENAVKFSPPNGAITVSLRDTPPKDARIPIEVRRRARGNSITIGVADEGPGIPDDEKEKIFTRFYQTEAGRAARGRGVGLGLTICREIVAAHGGAMWAADNEPRGTVFNVLLPNAVYAA